MIRIDMKGARLVGLFFLGLVLFNYPMISLVDTPAMIFGFPGLYIYLFVIWAGVITLVGLVIRLSSVLEIRSDKSAPNNP